MNLKKQIAKLIKASGLENKEVVASLNPMHNRIENTTLTNAKHILWWVCMAALSAYTYLTNVN